MLRDETGERTVERTMPAEGVALITIGGAPPNGCSFVVVERLASMLAEAREEGVRVVVVASATPSHWLGHASLRDLHSMFTGGAPSGDGAAWFRAIHELSRTEVVSIAAISGDAAGGGAELGWACDLRVAARSATLGQPESMIGVPTGLGGTARLTRLVGRSAAAEMVLDGAALPATRLHELGAVNRLVDAGCCTSVAVAWAKRLAGRPPGALAALKRILFESEELPLQEALANEQGHFQRVARAPEAIERMSEVQERYDAGALPRDLFDAPFEEG